MRVRPVALILVLSLTSIAHAQWQPDGYPVCTADHEQYSAQVISDGAGGAFITWYDYRAVSADLYAQRINAAGVAQWTLNGVPICTLPSQQVAPTLVADGAGGFIVSWYDDRSGNYDIYAQRVNSAGVPQWTANGVALCTAANSQVFQQIVSDGAGGAIVAWQDFRNGVDDDIYVRRINASGVAQWTANGVGLCVLAGDQLNPAIASDGAGGAIVAWQDNRSASPDIYAQRVTASGVVQWTANGAAISTAANTQYSPKIVPDGAGGAIIQWDDYRNGSGDIYVQRVNSAGTPQWTANGVGACVAAGFQGWAALVSDGSGGAIVAWEDNRIVNTDIYANRVSASGVPQWTLNGEPVCTDVNEQYGIAMTADGAGGCCADVVRLSDPGRRRVRAAHQCIRLRAMDD